METELTGGHGESLVPEGDQYTPWGVLRRVGWGEGGQRQAGPACTVGMETEEEGILHEPCNLLRRRMTRKISRQRGCSESCGETAL